MEGSDNSRASDYISKKKRVKSLCRGIKVLSPFRYLAKARDFYIKSIAECAGRANYRGLGVSMAGLPKSFSGSSVRNDDEFAELVRAASQSSKSSPVAQHKVIPKSSSTNRAPSVGRIDEDSPCYFGGSFRKIVAQPDLRFPRRRICRPARTSLGTK
ncbi:hypothetical protein SUGI_0559160 [Cryptomeria japonica]|uniref:uncharacterized protein LOC131075577 n=1 Tax=Cryptomeria japonica TaxID=3369 RepID=UPI002408CD1A|nr:uncharacterized protein LOC131075577 [Cryptomeria japonica]GLJ28413.1 hypothetical protein SUGI_0559160 [Cryptomeria japonica]